MKKVKNKQTLQLRRMFIVFTVYCAIVTVAALMSVNTAKHKAHDEVRRYREQSLQEIIKANDWATGEYPQWFIEWLNTEFYIQEAEE